MPVKLEDTDLQRRFWNSLTESANSYALSQLWLIGMSRYDLEPLWQNINDQFSDFEPGWRLQNAGLTIKNKWFFNDIYYNLARSVVFPSDGIETARMGVSNSGGIKGLVGQQRTDLPTVTITFLETNQSFVDLLIRPWCVLVGHRGLKAFDLRIYSLDLVCLQKTRNGLKIRKTISLQQAVPTEIDSEEYNYTGDKLIDRQIQFAYTKYTVKSGYGDAETDISIPTSDIIERVVERERAIPEQQLNLLERAHNLFQDVVGRVRDVQSAVGRIQGLVERVETDPTSLLTPSTVDLVTGAGGNALGAVTRPLGGSNAEVQATSGPTTQSVVDNARNSAGVPGPDTGVVEQ